MKHDRDIIPSFREQFAAEDVEDRLATAERYRVRRDELKARLTGEIYQSLYDMWTARITHYDSIIERLEA